MKLYLNTDDEKIQLGDFEPSELRKTVDNNKGEITLMVAGLFEVLPAEITIKVVKTPRGPYMLYANGEPVGKLTQGPLTSTERSRRYRNAKRKRGYTEVRNLYVKNKNQKLILENVVKVMRGEYELSLFVNDLEKELTL